MKVGLGTVPSVLLAATWLWAPHVWAASPPAALFEDVTAASGLPQDMESWGITAGDFDSDGDVDLIFTAVGEGLLRLYRNQGGLSFRPEIIGATVANTEFAAPIDANCDGNLDLIAGGWGAFVHLLLSDGSGAFVDATDAAGLTQTGETQSCGIAVGDIDMDGDLDVYLGRAESGDQLLINDGGKRFLDQTFRVWELGPGEGALGTEQAAFCDVDGNGTPDLFVTRLHEWSSLHVNDPKAGLTEDGGKRGVQDKGPNFGVVFLDAENDGDFDLFMVRGGFGGTQPNRFLVNNGAGSFTPATEKAGLGDEGRGWGCAAGDVDLDGDVDLYLTNDYDPNRLYLNDGSGVFTDATPPELAFAGVGNPSALLADLDNDGDLDLVVSSAGRGDRILRNTTDTRNWLKVRVNGGTGNRFGYGAKVRVFDAGHGGDLAHLRGLRQIDTALGWCAAPPPEAHFGVDAAGLYDIEVALPGQAPVSVTGVAPTQVVEVDAR